VTSRVNVMFWLADDGFSMHCGQIDYFRVYYVTNLANMRRRLINQTPRYII